MICLRLQTDACGRDQNSFSITRHLGLSFTPLPSECKVHVTCHRTRSALYTGVNATESQVPGLSAPWPGPCSPGHCCSIEATWAWTASGIFLACFLIRTFSGESKTGGVNGAALTYISRGSGLFLGHRAKTLPQRYGARTDPGLCPCGRHSRQSPTASNSPRTRKIPRRGSHRGMEHVVGSGGVRGVDGILLWLNNSCLACSPGAKLDRKRAACHQSKPQLEKPHMGGFASFLMARRRRCRLANPTANPEIKPLFCHHLGQAGLIPSQTPLSFYRPLPCAARALQVATVTASLPDGSSG